MAYAFSQISKVWLQFPTDKTEKGFGVATSIIELVQRNGTEYDNTFDVHANAGGFHHMTFSVPDLMSARSRFEKLGVTIDDVQIPHTQLIVLRDPDNYPIQIMSQEFDLHAELHDVCRDVVVEGTEQSLEDILRSKNPDTLAEAGLTSDGNKLSVPCAKVPCTSPR